MTYATLDIPLSWEVRDQRSVEEEFLTGFIG
jgi:hypothetical protein